MDSVVRITQAREDSGLSVKDLAEKLSVDIGTVRNWEAGRRQLTLERLLEIAGLLGVSVTYLLGLDERVSNTSPVEKAMLPVLHRTPVWIQSCGWALVNSAKQHMIFADGNCIPFELIQEPIYMTPPAMSLSLRGVGAPLNLKEAQTLDRIWVEPVSIDCDLAAELRGWYHPHRQRFVKNEFGNRFYFDGYGSKWLAFKDCLIHNSNDP